MAIVRWDPFRDVATLQDRINRLFSESFGQSRDLEDDMKECAWRPAVDIYEAEHEVILRAELPGIRKEDVSVEVKDNLLTLRGERFPDPGIKEDHSAQRPVERISQLHIGVKQEVTADRITTGVPGPEAVEPVSPNRVLTSQEEPLADDDFLALPVGSHLAQPQ